MESWWENFLEEYGPESTILLVFLIILLVYFFITN